MRARIGIYNLHLNARGGGEKLALVLADALSRTHEVWLLTDEPVDRAGLEAYFDVDLSRVRVEVVAARPRTLAKRVAERLPFSGRWNAVGDALHAFRQLRAMRFDVLVNLTYASDLVNPAAHGLFLCMFPHDLPAPREGASAPARLLRAATEALETAVMGRPTRDALGSYATVVSISEYTRTWVTRKWARPSDVVYPVCDAVGVGGEKTRSILHVGRFNASDGDQNHHKRQDVLLDAFKALPDLHADGWTMHFAGSTGQGPGGAEYAAALVERARGYPVTFHFDADLGALHALYRSAAVYWHATGYGHSDELYPAKQEHFGITAVEAMSAGAVPVVIRSGGLQETVRHEHDGLLWSTVPELLAHTRRLAADDALRTRFGLAAVASSARFSREAYADAMGAVIERALARRP